VARTAPLCDAIIVSSYCALQHNTQYDTHTQVKAKRTRQRAKFVTRLVVSKTRFAASSYQKVREGHFAFSRGLLAEVIAAQG